MPDARPLVGPNAVFLGQEEWSLATAAVESEQLNSIKSELEYSE